MLYGVPLVNKVMPEEKGEVTIVLVIVLATRSFRIFLAKNTIALDHLLLFGNI